LARRQRGPLLPVAPLEQVQLPPLVFHWRVDH